MIDTYTKFLGPFVSKYLSGHARTIKIKKNILAMVALKGVSIVVGFILVPMTLHYLNSTNYGIWLTLSSMIGWFTFFDIGLGNGLRNKFAEAMANNDLLLARSYVSTTYAFLLSIIGSVFLLFLFINPLLNWSRILNTTPDVGEDLSLLVLITFGFFSARFVFGLINTILVADQKPALSGVLESLSNLLSLLVVWILKETTHGSLLFLGSAVSCSMAVIPILASLWLFRSTYKKVAPSKAYVSISHAKALMSIGLKFFFLQIAAIIVFSTSNIVITQLFSPADVVPYNVAFKYYSIVSMLFSIVLTPFWSAYTEAYVQNDNTWIKRTILVLKQVWFAMLLIVVLMSFFAADFYDLWVGKDVQIPLEVSLAMGLYVLINAWANIYVNFINGAGKVDLQIIAAVTVAIFNIPLAILLSKYLHFGITGVILAPCICLLPWCFVWPVQVRKILSNTGTGIWLR